MKLWDNTKKWVSEFVGDFIMFGKDLGKETYRRFVQIVSAALIALLLFFLGADRIQRWWEHRKDRAENHTTRTIHGNITDVNTNEPLANIKVGIVEQNDSITSSDENGNFTLRFRVHKDSSFISISFSGDGYIPSAKLRSIPLSKGLENVVQDFTLKKSDLNQ